MFFGYDFVFSLIVVDLTSFGTRNLTFCFNFKFVKFLIICQLSNPISAFYFGEILFMKRS